MSRLRGACNWGNLNSGKVVQCAARAQSLGRVCAVSGDAAPRRLFLSWGLPAVLRVDGVTQAVVVRLCVFTCCMSTSQTKCWYAPIFGYIPSSIPVLRDPPTVSLRFPKLRGGRCRGNVGGDVRAAGAHARTPCTHPLYP